MAGGVEELNLLQVPRRLQTGAVHHHGDGQTWRVGREKPTQSGSQLREAQTESGPLGSTSLTLHRPLPRLAGIKVWLGGEAGLKINVADAGDPQ